MHSLFLLIPRHGRNLRCLLVRFIRWLCHCLLASEAIRLLGVGSMSSLPSNAAILSIMISWLSGRICLRTTNGALPIVWYPSIFCLRVNAAIRHLILIFWCFGPKKWLRRFSSHYNFFLPSASIMIALSIFKQGIVKLIVVLRRVDLLKQVSSSRIVYIAIEHSCMRTAIWQLKGPSLVLIKVSPSWIQITRYEIFSSRDTMTASSSLLWFPPKYVLVKYFTFAPYYFVSDLITSSLSVWFYLSLMTMLEGHCLRRKTRLIGLEAVQISCFTN